jgi:guanylate kinase
VAGPPLLVVITGPSGAGKDSVLDELRQLPDRPYAFGITATTRPPRPYERDGEHYFFVSQDEFQSMIERDELLEHARVYQHTYGVPRGPIRDQLESGQDVLIRTDVQGAHHIASVVPDAVTIFISAPSHEELERRLRTRGGDSEEQVDLRLRTARSEMDQAGDFDYTVVNDDLPSCVQEVESIIERERSRPDRQPVRI